MNTFMLNPLRVPELDPGFVPAVLWNRAYRETVQDGVPLVLGLEGENGRFSRYETVVRPVTDPETLRYVERLVKFLLWARGGWRLVVGGPAELAAAVAADYAPGGARAFDADMMEKCYGRPFTVEAVPAAAVPPAQEAGAVIGGHLGGCRIGFDLGASDYKVAAVQEGEVLYSDEFAWDPRPQTDPTYHYEHLNAGLRAAASYLPRVDAIGGSSAGVIVNNCFMVASLLRNVKPERMQEAQGLFERLREEWGVPLEVVNDGDVTALAGALSLEENGVLGIAMGSSEAAGFLTPEGRMTGWLSELAFAPVDFNPEAGLEEWSGDQGVGALYFSQQAVNRLIPAAGIPVPPEMGLPERLRLVQFLMGQDDPRALAIYRTIGTYLGYSLAYYAEFYDFRHALILGRVTSGKGGGLILSTAQEVLAAEFPDLAGRVNVQLPDEKSRRVGQACAAASLPALQQVALAV
jgi:predicted NBD/HSP70 family sugar kinase